MELLVTRGVTYTTENFHALLLRKDQILLSVSSLDFSFIVEQNISDIFSVIT